MTEMQSFEYHLLKSHIINASISGLYDIWRQDNLLEYLHEIPTIFVIVIIIIIANLPSSVALLST